MQKQKLSCSPTCLAVLRTCRQIETKKREYRKRKQAEMLVELRCGPFCLSSSLQPRRLNYFSKRITAVGETRKACIVRPQISYSAVGDGFGCRVFVISDLHTDYPVNMKWVKCLSSEKHKKDVLLVAGDVAETYDKFCFTMSLLKDKFEHVFYVPGNHDLWCRSEVDHCLNSLEKMSKLIDACRGLGIQTKPKVVDDLGIIPLFSWYHDSFDREEDINGIRIPSLEMVCKDFHACKWPEELSSRDTSLALHFDSMNEEHWDKIKRSRRSVVKLLHSLTLFPASSLSRQELCPEKRILFYPNLPKIIGSDSLEVWIRSIHGTKGSASACHVFGHTHFCWDAVLDGIRYVQAPLAYPKERKRRMNGGETRLPFCIYSDGKFAGKISPCFWSDYYETNQRASHNTQLAPWVVKLYNG